MFQTQSIAISASEDKGSTAAADYKLNNLDHTGSISGGVWQTYKVRNYFLAKSHKIGLVFLVSTRVNTLDVFPVSVLHCGHAIHNSASIDKK